MKNQSHILNLRVVDYFYIIPLFLFIHKFSIESQIVENIASKLAWY